MPQRLVWSELTVVVGLEPPERPCGFSIPIFRIHIGLFEQFIPASLAELMVLEKCGLDFRHVDWFLLTEL